MSNIVVMAFLPGNIVDCLLKKCLQRGGGGTAPRQDLPLSLPSERNKRVGRVLTDTRSILDQVSTNTLSIFDRVATDTSTDASTDISTDITIEAPHNIHGPCRLPFAFRSRLFCPSFRHLYKSGKHFKTYTRYISIVT